MKKTVIAETYLINTKEIAKEKTDFTSVEAIEKFLIEKIEAHPIATYIASFDHYAHTNSLENGMIPPSIKAVKNVLCCFGMAIPNAVFMGVKPMSIAVVETDTAFVMSFEEAPAPSAQKAMENWIDEIENRS